MTEEQIKLQTKRAKNAAKNFKKLTKGKSVYKGGGGVKLLIETPGSASEILAIMHRSKKGEIYLRTTAGQPIKFPWEPDNATSLYAMLNAEYAIDGDVDPLKENNEIFVTVVTRELIDDEQAVEEFLANEEIASQNKGFVKAAYEARKNGEPTMVDFFITDLDLD